MSKYSDKPASERAAEKSRYWERRNRREALVTQLSGFRTIRVKGTGQRKEVHFSRRMIRKLFNAGAFK